MMLFGNLVARPALSSAVNWANAKMFGVANPKSAAAYGFASELLASITFVGASRIAAVATMNAIRGNDPSMRFAELQIAVEAGKMVATPIAMTAGAVGGYFLANKAGYPITAKEIAYLTGIAMLEIAILNSL